MADNDIATRIAQLQARRAARGMADPLNRLNAHIAAAVERGEPVFVNIPADDDSGADDDDSAAECTRTGHHRDTGRGVCAECGEFL